MSKILVSLFLLLVLACTSIKTNDLIEKKQQLSNRDVLRVFDEFEQYLKNNFNINDDRGLNAAKEHKSKLYYEETYSERGAKIYAYLNEFDKCDPQAIEYMRDVLRGRPYAQPGSEAKGRDGRRAKTRLEKLLEGTLERASEKCKSFVETWFRDTESKLDPSRKKALYEYLSHDVVKPGCLNELPQRVAEKMLKDENLSKELSSYKYDPLWRFFYRKYNLNLVQPCEKYIEVMSPFMTRIGGLGLITTESPNILFDKPSTDLLDAASRFAVCKKYAQGSIVEIAHQFVSEVVDKFQQGKEEIPSEVKEV